MRISNKAKCSKCRKVAVWFYMPGESDYCDDCVPRGCSCNSDPETGEEPLDDKGRRYPCCEYEHIDDVYTLVYTRDK